MVGFNLHVFDDGSFKVNQYTVVDVDPAIHFGPLKARLSELFSMGFTLQATGFARKNHEYSCKIHLICGKEKYLVGKIPVSVVIEGKTPLQSVIKERQQMMGKMSVDSYTPFEQIERKYPPVKRKKCLMVGNQTLEQYINNL